MPRENAVKQITDDPLSTSRTVVLLLVDGWGIASDSEGSAIRLDNSKNFLKLSSEYPAGTLVSEDLSESMKYRKIGAQGKFSAKLSEQKIKQFYLTESEKSSAVLGFFVGEENINQVESRIISSPVCDSYSLEPEMSLEELSRVAVKVVRDNTFGFVLISLPNIDLVASSGDLIATKKAVAKVDSFLGKITEEVLLKNGVLVISSLGGKAERMLDIRTELVDKEGTFNPVPLLIIGNDFKGRSLFNSDAPGGDLSLLAPVANFDDLPKTILALMNVDDHEISGKNLLKK
jgi:bisphosphoglycerate-independent phosphoglycerate mutase (AlkP superfamily)